MGPKKAPSYQSYQSRVCFYVPPRVHEFFKNEPGELTQRDGVRWTQGRLLTRMVDDYLRQKRAQNREVE